MPEGLITKIDMDRRIGWLKELSSEEPRFFGFNESPELEPGDLYVDCRVTYELSPSPGRKDKAINLQILAEQDSPEREYGLVYRTHRDGYSFAKTNTRGEVIFIPPAYNVSYGDFFSFVKAESEKGLNASAVKIVDKKYGFNNGDMSITPCQSFERLTIDYSNALSFLGQDAPVEYIDSEKGIELVQQTHAIHAFAAFNQKLVIARLKELAHPGESWAFKTALEHDPYPILRSYFIHTFERLWDEDCALEQRLAGQSEEKINSLRKICRAHIQENGLTQEIAVFNTGLIDRYYREIFGVCHRNPNTAPGNPPWVFRQFAVPGSRLGTILLSLKSLPERARYYEKSMELFFDPDLEIYPDFDHIFERTSRIHLLKYKHIKESDMSESMRSEFDEDIIRKINTALETARRKIRWNYKTAIPQFFTTRKKMQFLIPLCLDDPSKVDLAMAVGKLPDERAYTGHTILPLEWAYSNARLLARPDSDWLRPEDIASDWLRPGDYTETDD